MLYKLSVVVLGCMVVLTANCQLNENTGDNTNATIKTAVGVKILPAPYAISV